MTQPTWDEIGARLEKCRACEFGRDEDGWWAWVALPGQQSLVMGEGKTQLAALTAALDAAEGQA